MTHIPRIALVAAAAAAALAAPAAADAKPPKQGDRAAFRATLVGHQVSTWHMEDPGDPADPCNIGRRGDGDQTIEFELEEFELGAARPPRGRPRLYGTNGRPWVWSVDGGPALRLTATRNAQLVETSPPTPQQCGDHGGPDDDTVVVPPRSDCGDREGAAAEELYFFTDPSRELARLPVPDRDHLKLTTQEHGWGEDRASYLGDLYDNCPFLLEGATAEHNGQILPTSARIPEARLFDRRRRKLVISGHTIRKYAEGTTTGQTIVAWNLRLTRIQKGS